MKLWTEIVAALARDGVVALVTLCTIRGSSPREAGARMLVHCDGGFRGSIGGGALEHETLRETLALLTNRQPAASERVHLLGPDLGQCCGGQVTVRIEVLTVDDRDWIAALAGAEGGDSGFETVAEKDSAGRLRRKVALAGAQGERERFGLDRTPVFLFGAGHVGRAVALALAPLPFQVSWIDSRIAAFPDSVPANARLLHAVDPARRAAQAVPGTLALVMTHSHPLDLSIVAAALASGLYPYVGLIGSATKRARFVSQLRQSGLHETQLDVLACPIGGSLVRDKQPAAIAAVAVVDLLRARERAAGIQGRFSAVGANETFASL